MAAKPVVLSPSVVIVVLVAAVAAIGAAARFVPHGGAAPLAQPVRNADLVMQDRLDGSIAVLRAGDRDLVELLPPASNGFLRVVLAGLVRERRRERMGAETLPFHLTQWSDGRLTIDDTATGRLIEVEAFGPSNAAIFKQLLDLSSPPQAR